MKTYTFYVTPTEAAGVSRTVELPVTWTLEDLHDAIQQAFELDGEAGFSFYMSGEAWDESTEYTHFDELEDETLDESLDDAEMWADEVSDETLDEDLDTAIDLLAAPDEPDDELTGAPQDSVAALEGPPSPDQLRAMFAELKTNPELRAQITAQLADQLKLPAFMLDALLSNADALLSLLPEDTLNQMMAQGFDTLTDDEGPLGDTRETRLEQVDMAVGQTFLYLYDFDLERHFEVHLESVQEQGLSEDEFPRVLESVGALPPDAD